MAQLKFILLFLVLTTSLGKGFSQGLPTIRGTSDTMAVSVDTFPNSRPIDRVFEPPRTVILNPVSKSDSLGGAVFDTMRVERLVIQGYSSVADGIRYVKVNGQGVNMISREYWEHTVVLAPFENDVIIETRSNSGLYTTDTLPIYHKPVKERNYLFLIAADKYQYWPRLENPVNDTKTIGKLLTEKYNFNESCMVNLYNEEFALEKLDKAFRKLIHQITKYDNLVIYYAGHGYLDRTLKEGYLIPPSARKNTITDYLSNSAILKYIAAFKAKHILLIADACYSGSIYLHKRGIKPKTMGDGKPVKKSVMENVSQYKSRWIMASGRLEAVDDALPGKKHSPFAYYIIKFLSENQKEAFLVSELANQVRMAVSHNTNHTPMDAPLKSVGDEGGEMVFRVRKAE